MRISSNIDRVAKLVGEEKAVELFAKAGFDGWDFSMFHMFKDNRSTVEYLRFARQLKQIGLDNGIVCSQSHAPFPVREPAVRARLEDAIACTAEAGGEICVIHPDNDKSPEENAEMYETLLPFARSCGVKIATENMWNWDHQKDQASFAACATPESFCRHIDILEDDYMVACLDIGHAEMRGVGTSAVEMIKALDHRLQALHIHDNDKWHDSHQLPFTMDIDFVPIAKALKEIGYKGFYTLEVGPYMNVYDKETVTEGLQNLAAAAKKFASMCTE